MKSSHPLLKDTLILCLCVVVTLALLKAGTLDLLFSKLNALGILGIFISGIFFTSIITTAGAVLALTTFTVDYQPLIIALVGALGAVIGDLILFLFVRDRIVKDIDEVVRSARKRPHELIKAEFLRWINPFLGALIIASPLPDELGLALLGFSKIGTKRLIIISYVMNALGILVITTVAITLL